MYAFVPTSSTVHGSSLSAAGSLSRCCTLVTAGRSAHARSLARTDGRTFECCWCDRVAMQVRCSPDQKAITAMASSDGEVVDLCAPVTATDAVESWLHQLTDGMQKALQAGLRGVAGLSDPFAKASAQVLGLYHALSFTERCVRACAEGHTVTGCFSASLLTHSNSMNAWGCLSAAAGGFPMCLCSLRSALLTTLVSPSHSHTVTVVASHLRPCMPVTHQG